MVNNYAIRKLRLNTVVYNRTPVESTPMGITSNKTCSTANLLE